nr:hypothetical protein [Tanacetum cinerariifolium]
SANTFDRSIGVDIPSGVRIHCGNTRERMICAREISTPSGIPLRCCDFGGVTDWTVWESEDVNVAGAREKVGSLVVQQSGIQCFNCKKFGHFAKECRKPKRHDWLAEMDEEVDEQEFKEHYSYMAKIQEVPTADTCTNSEPAEQVQNDARYNVFANDLQHFEQSESVSNTCLVETDDSNVIPDSPDTCDDDIQNDQNDVESDDERAALANLISNLKLDVDENKKIQKQLKKANTTLAQELKECKAILAETSKSLEESISVRDSCLVAQSRLSLRSIRPLMTVILTMTNLNGS